MAKQDIQLPTKSHRGGLWDLIHLPSIRKNYPTWSSRDTRHLQNPMPDIDHGGVVMLSMAGEVIKLEIDRQPMITSVLIRDSNGGLPFGRPDYGADG